MLLVLDQWGRMKLHRDLSKWHNIIKGKKSEVVYEVHPSRRELASAHRLKYLAGFGPLEPEREGLERQVA